MLYFSEPEPEVPGVCVKDCSGKPNGDYQSCTTCKGFITCSNNVLYNMPCPANTVWDDVVKRCEWVSTTCKSSTTSTQRPVTSKVTFHTSFPRQLLILCIFNNRGIMFGSKQSLEIFTKFIH